MGIVIALFAGCGIGVITICLCMVNHEGEYNRISRDREIENLQEENEYLHMWQAEIREKISEMEPPDGFPSVYCHAYWDAINEIRRIIQ